MRKYFANTVSGFNADLKRHMEAEQRLLTRIQELESNPEDEWAKIGLSAYRNSLYALRASKAELLTKLGRKY